jgi:hypothetical protein
MTKCIPHSATQYELLIKTEQIKVYYNRLQHLATHLEKTEFDCGSAVKTAILTAYSNIMTVKTDEGVVEFPDDRDEFLVQWRRKAFDNQPLLYPPQKMYRNMPYSRVEVDDWLYAHRAQMKYMNGDVYWRKSPAYTQIEASVKFAFYNYPDVIAKEGEGEDAYFMRRLTMEPTPERAWNLESPPTCPYNAPNKTFNTYYNTVVADFCDYVERSNADRTDEHLEHIYTQASKIRVMSDWMRWGIDGIKMDGGFILLATLDTVVKVLPDLSNHPTVLYIEFINYFAYAVCMDEDTSQIVRMIKMCNSIIT